MTFVKVQSGSNGQIESVYRGLKKNTSADSQWYSVQSELLDSAGELYLIEKAEKPTDGWDKSDQTIGVIK